MLTAWVTCCLPLVAKADIPPAPNLFRASPAQYDFRIAEVRGDYGQDFQFQYDNFGCLLRQVGLSEDGVEIEQNVYTYDANHYLKQHEECVGQKDDGTPVVDLRQIYTRDANGYIIGYNRWKRRAQEETDYEMIEDIRGSYTYNDKQQPTHAVYMYYDGEKEEWYEGLVVDLTYTEDGKLESQTKTVNNALFEKEELTYNEQGKIIGLTLTKPGANDVVWMYTYNAAGDITQSGRPGYYFTYSYYEDKTLDKTFIPRKNIVDKTLFGLRNAITWYAAQTENSYVHAIRQEDTTGAGMVYEPIDKTSIDNVMLGDKADRDALVVEGSWLRIKLGASEVGSTLRIFDLSGRCVKMQQVDKAIERIDLTTLPSGNYIVKIAQHQAKIVR